MMSAELVIYLMDVSLPLFLLLVSISGFCLVSFGVEHMEKTSNPRETRPSVRMLTVGIVCGFLAAAIPAPRTLAAVYVIPKIEEIKNIQEALNSTPQEIRDKAEKWLEQNTELKK